MGRYIDDHPYGYEVKYDENGHVEYEGYIYWNRKIGLCIEYYSDIEKVKSNCMKEIGYMVVLFCTIGMVTLQRKVFGLTALLFHHHGVCTVRTQSLRDLI